MKKFKDQIVKLLENEPDINIEKLIYIAKTSD